MTTEDHCESLWNLSAAKALGVIEQARRQMDLNHDDTGFVDNRPAAEALDACLAQDLTEFGRVAAIRAIHQAFLQITAATKYLANPPDNTATLAALQECLVEAGHIGFPLAA